MAQAQVIAKVSSLSGEAYARDNAGKLRRLKAGDAIREGETVVAGDGAQVVLLLADGREMTVLPGETARLDAEVAALVKPDASDSAVVNNPDEFERIAKALATGGDLDALLEDPAAGVAGPGNEGHSFVEFLRVVESVDSLSYQFPAARIGTPEIIENPASPVSELGDANAPTANAGAGTPPTGSDAGYTLNEDTARTFAAGDFGFADADAGQTLQAVRIDSLPAAGNLTFNGVPAMVGQIIAAADLAQLVYTPGANASGAPYAGFDFSVQDSSGAFATTPNHITLTVAPIDDTSLLAPDSQTVAEDTVATGNVLANDSDLDNALDVTGFTVVGVAGSFNAGQTATIAGIGTLTIATNGDYSFTPLVDWNGTLPTATYTTNTGSTSTLDLSVTPVNDAPTPADPGNPAFDPAAGNYSVTTLEDTPVSGQVVGTDADGDPLTYAKCSDPANGTVTVNVDGTWTYTPGPNYNGNDSFMVTIADGHGGSATSTVFVGVTPVNDGPTPADPGNPAFDPATGNYNVTTPEDTPVSGQVLGTDSDGDPLTYAKGSDPANGTVMINADGTWTYTPGANYNGSDSFTVSIADGHGGSATSTVFVGVTPVNDGPTPADPGNPAFDPTTGNYNVTTPEDTPVSGQVVGADADGDLLTYAKGSDPANGTVSVNADGTWTYTPGPNYNGSDSFTVSIADGHGGSATSTVFVGVTPVNDGPTPADPGNPAFDPATGNYNVTTPEDTPVSGQVVGTDADGDALTYAKSSDPTNGTVTVNADGTWTYTPGANYNGSDSFTVSIADGHGGSTTSTVFIGVTPVDDASLLALDSQTVAEDTVATGNVLANDGDVDNALSVAGFTLAGVAGNFSAGQTASIAGIGTLTIAANGDYSFTPLANWNGTVPTASYTTNTGSTSTLDLTVTPLDDTPSVSDDGASTPEDTPVIIRVLDNDRDADGDALTITAIDGQPVAAGDTVAVANGTATLNADGTITFTPVSNYHGSATFTYTASDGRTPVSGDVNVTVTAVNDAPLAGNDSVTTAEDTPVTILVRANDSDADADPLTVTAFTNPANGTLTQNAQGNLVYTPNANFNGADSFTYTISDGQGGFDTATVTVNVGGSNDAPLANPDAGSTGEDATLVVSAANGVIQNDSDLDGDSLSVSGIAFGASTGTVGSPLVGAWGSLTLHADGSYTYVSNAAAQALDDGESRTDIFTYTVSDPGGLSSTTTLSLTVSGANDGPLAIDDARTTPEDTPVTIVVLGNDSDVDGEALHVSAIAGQPVTAGDSVAVTNGTATLNADGTITFTPAAGYNGPADFSYTITDGTTSDTANVHLVIDDVNDPPVALDNVVNGSEDSPVNFDPRSNDSDPDGDPLTITAIDGQPLDLAIPVTLSQGVVSLNADGTLTFTPNANVNGPVSFQYTIADGRGGSDTALVNLNIAAVDDPSTLVADTGTTPEDTALSGNVLTNDGDIDNSLAVASFAVSGVAGSFNAGQTATVAGIGAIALGANGDYSFAPAANWHGTVPTVSYTTNTGSSSTLAITVTSVDDAFADADEKVSVAEDTTLTGSVLTGTTSVDGLVTVSDFTVAGVAGSFTAGQTASIAGVGMLQINADGSYSFTPVANYNGAVPVATYTLSDGSSGDTSMLSITVTPVDDTFGDVNETVSVAEDTTLTGSVLTGTSSVDGPVTVSGFTVASIASGFTAGQTASIAGVGTLIIAADGGYSFTPAANYVGAVPVASYTLSDGSSSDTSTLAITVTPMDDAFTDADEAVSVAEDTALTGTVLNGTTSVDGPVTVSGFTVAGIPGSFTAGQTATSAGIGTLTIAADGSYTFTPAANYNGAVPVATYTLSDGSSGDTSTLSIAVTPVGDAFTDADESVSIAEDTTLNGTVLAGTTSVDGPVTVSGFTVAGISGSFTAGQTATIAGVGALQINADGSYSFAPAANYNGAVPVATYTLSDGSSGNMSTLSITVTPVNDNPLAVDDSNSVPINTATSGNVLANDSDLDGNPLSVTGFSVAGVAGSFTAGQTASIAGVGALQINGDGSYTFTPAANYAGAIPVATYAVSDGQGGTDSATLSLSMGNNAAPDARDDGPVGVTEDTPVSGNVLVNDSDPNGNPLSVTGFTVAGVAGSFAAGQAASIAGVGTLQINVDGSYSFAPAANYNGPLPIATYSITDGLGGTDSATLALGPVTSVNDAPLLSNTPLVMSVAEDAGNPFGAVGSPVSSLIGGISDADGGALQGIAIVGSNLTHGSWYFTTDNGASWHLVAASPSSSLLLANDANTRLYFQPDANFNGTATAALTVRAWDQSSGTPGTWVNTVSNGGNTAFSSATDTIDVQVTAVNDAPIAFGAAALAPIAEDSTNPPGATVAALFGGAGNFHDNTDQVAGGSSANTFAGIAISQYNAIPAIGTWQYSTDGGASWIALGDATLASAVTLQGTDLLRFVPAANYNGDATQLRANLIESGVSITSGDVVNLVGATGGTTHYSQSTVLLSETVTPVDDPSVLVADSRTVAEDHPATGNVLTNDSDVDNALSVVSFSVGGTAYAVGAVATLTGVGTLTMATNGSYTFTPVANWNGTVPTVSYTTNTGGASTLDITVTPVDDAFADANETISVAEDTTLTGSVLTGTTSVDGPVTVSSFTVAGVAGSFTAGQAASIAGVGTLQINADGGYSFTPAANYNGAVPIATYTLSDGSSGDTSTLAVTVTPVNDAFSDADETVNIAEDTMLTGSVLSGTSSVDGLVTVSGFTVAGVAGSFTAGQAASIVGVGTLQINADGGYSFTPAANYNGAVPVVTYTLSDGSSGDTSTLAITVIPVVDAFDDANETVNIAEDTTLTGSVLSGTSSADGPVTVTGFTVAGIAGSFVAGQAASIAGVGTLQINADGSYSFTPAANYAGAVPVATYTLSDGSNGDTSTLSITVTSDNDAPTVGSAAISVSEEGVAGGIADTAGSPGDSTNLAIRSGTIGIADSDSPVTVSLQAPTAALSAGGVAITWSGADSQMLIGSAGGIEVARVTIDNSGNYQVTLSQVLDHGVAGSEDSLSFNVGVTASDGAMSASGAIALTVEDDSPLATSSAVAVGGTATNTNLAIVLDLSGSMDDPSGLTNATRLAVTKEAIKELIDTYDGMGEVMVNVTVFGSSGTSGTWMTAANALQFVTAAQSFSSSGTMYTNYDAALAAAMTAYGGAGKLSGANVQNVLYFLSDGEPNRGDGNNTALTNTNAGSSDNGIQGVEETIWTNFLSSNHVSAYAIGLGTGVTTANMDPVAYDGVNGTGRDSLSVADLNDLSSVLASTIESRVTGAIMIDGGGSGGFGADGGYLAALTYGNNTFSFDGSALTVGGAGTTAYSFDAASHVLAVTAAGGPFVVDMDTGEYTYTRTPSRTVLQESFGYTLTDHDGDTAVGTLTINLPDYDTAPVARDDRVVVASGSVSSNTVTLKDAWLTWNDSDAEAATLTVSAVSNATSHASSQVVDAVSASSGGSGAFSYTVSDGGQTNDAAVSITTVNSSTLSGTGLDNILVGDSTGETIRGYEGNDVLVGNAGNDTLSGGSGIDLLIGGTGNDSLSGGIGSDTFAWSLADQGTAATPARDTISDFSVAAKADGGDMLDLRDLLQGENHASGTGNLTDFLHFTRSGSDTVIDIKPTGTSGSVTQQIVMSGVDLTAGNTLNDQAIIQDLLTKGKLLTD